MSDLCVLPSRLSLLQDTVDTVKLLGKSPEFSKWFVCPRALLPASIPLCLWDSVYHGVSLTKLCVTVIKLTVGQISVNDKKLGDRLPLGFEMKEIAFHAYKVMMTAFTCVFLALGTLFPQTIVNLLYKLKIANEPKTPKYPELVDNPHAPSKQTVQSGNSSVQTGRNVSVLSDQTPNSPRSRRKTPIPPPRRTKKQSSSATSTQGTSKRTSSATSTSSHSKRPPPVPRTRSQAMLDAGEAAKGVADEKAKRVAEAEAKRVADEKAKRAAEAKPHAGLLGSIQVRGSASSKKFAATTEPIPEVGSIATREDTTLDVISRSSLFQSVTKANTESEEDSPWSTPSSSGASEGTGSSSSTGDSAKGSTEANVLSDSSGASEGTGSSSSAGGSANGSTKAKVLSDSSGVSDGAGRSSGMSDSGGAKSGTGPKVSVLPPPPPPVREVITGAASVLNAKARQAQSQSS